MVPRDHITNTIRAVIRALRQGIIPNVVETTHEDYGEIAELPALVLHAPRLTQKIIEPANEPVERKDQQAGTCVVSPPACYYDMEFDFDLVCNTTIGDTGFFPLVLRCLQFFQVTTSLSVDLTDEAGVIYDRDVYEMQARPEMAPVPTAAGLHAARGTFVVVDVRIPDPREVAGTLVREREFVYRDTAKGIEEVRHYRP